jgi:hypothetical protein
MTRVDHQLLEVRAQTKVTGAVEEIMTLGQFY